MVNCPWLSKKPCITPGLIGVEPGNLSCLVDAGGGGTGCARNGEHQKHSTHVSEELAVRVAGRVVVEPGRLCMGVQAEKLVDLGNRGCSRKVNGLESAAHFQEAVVGPAAVDVKSGGVGNAVVVDANDLGLDRTREILLREGVRQHERETFVRVSGQPASAVPGDGAEFVDAQQLPTRVKQTRAARPKLRVNPFNLLPQAGATARRRRCRVRHRQEISHADLPAAAMGPALRGPRRSGVRKSLSATTHHKHNGQSQRTRLPADSRKRLIYRTNRGRVTGQRALDAPPPNFALTQFSHSCNIMCQCHRSLCTSKTSRTCSRVSAYCASAVRFLSRTSSHSRLWFAPTPYAV